MKKLLLVLILCQVVMASELFRIPKDGTIRKTVDIPTASCVTNGAKSYYSTQRVKFNIYNDRSENDWRILYVTFYDKDTLACGGCSHNEYGRFECGIFFGMTDAKYAIIGWRGWDNTTLDDFYCPIGYSKKIVNGCGSCYKPYKCSKNEFATSDTTCSELPEGAKRKTKIGWTCEQKFYKSRNWIDSVCIHIPMNSKKTSDTTWECKTGFYRNYEGSCVSIPKNSKNTSDSTWECKKGFVEIDEQCVSKSTCANEQMYEIETNECINPPENGYWSYNEYSRKELAEFRCNDGYTLVDSICEVKAVCDSGVFYNEADNKCYNPPENGDWIDGAETLYDFECREGFYRDGNFCKQLPENSFRSHSDQTTWYCNTGYVQRGIECEPLAVCTPEQRYDINKNRCFDPPKNGHWVNKTSDNFRYSCDSGFVDVGHETCEKKVECTDKHYIIGNTCYPLPTNSEKVSDYVWKCKGGFERIDDYCVKECDEDEILSDGKCKNIPSHAHKTKYNDYDCDFGYHYERKSNGKAYCREDPRIKIREEENRSAWRHVTYETMMRDTDYNIEWPLTHFHFDIGGWVSVPDIGFEIGLEMLFGESELFGLFTDVAINHHVERQAHDEWETEYYTIDMVSMNVGFQLLLSRPTKNMRLYFKPMLSFPLTTKFDMDRYHREWVSNPVFPGIETGIRLWDLLDVGVRYSDHPVKIDGENMHNLFKFVVRFSI